MHSSTIALPFLYHSFTMQSLILPWRTNLFVSFLIASIIRDVICHISMHCSQCIQACFTNIDCEELACWVDVTVDQMCRLSAHVFLTVYTPSILRVVVPSCNIFCCRSGRNAGTAFNWRLSTESVAIVLQLCFERMRMVLVFQLNCLSSVTVLHAIHVTCHIHSAYALLISYLFTFFYLLYLLYMLTVTVNPMLSISIS